MSNPLEKIIKEDIRLAGPMSLEKYWSLCLFHPQYGYYTSRNPLGKNGDFITAPEVSQMFGEMLAMWFIEVWNRLGQPAKFYMVEGGPGRGTLMADMVRVFSKMPEFINAAEFILIEVSPTLRDLQINTIRDVSIRHITTVEQLPEDHPIFFVANELLDAMPIRQLIKTPQGWLEKHVGLNADDQLVFGLVPVTNVHATGDDGDVLELSHSRDLWVHQLHNKLLKTGGAGLFIDYGANVPNMRGDTFQAVKAHEYTDPLAEPGVADLTSHIDFARLNHIVQGKVSTQGAFLQRLGIEMRCNRLAAGKDEEVQAELQGQLDRLIGDGQMGQLFQVCGFSNDPKLDLPGFE